MNIDPKMQSIEQITKLLSQSANEIEDVADWPADQLDACGRADVHRWFVDTSLGGLAWSPEEQIRGYFELAKSCLTTTFILTQRTGAVKRIAGSKNEVAREKYLPDLLSGKTFSTVGISHLTTSRQHTGKPALAAVETGAGFQLDGMSPWVTGGAHSDSIVVGATLENQRQILAVVDTRSPGVDPRPGCNLVALSASCTDAVHFDNVLVPHENVLAGPVENVMQQGVGGNTGGLQTSTLALGLAAAAAEYLIDAAEDRDYLIPMANKLTDDCQRLSSQLFSLARGDEVCSSQDLRSAANSIALRSTQAALTAAKGAGFVTGHATGRWAREALFFLVWSCPAPVASANLCELAGLSS